MIKFIKELLEQLGLDTNTPIQEAREKIKSEITSLKRENESLKNENKSLLDSKKE